MQTDNTPTRFDSQNLWIPTLVPPHPRLHQLHDFVLNRNDKRRPKWKFRIATDLVVQMQPVPTKTDEVLCYFDCLALHCDRAGLQLLIDPKSRTGLIHEVLIFDLIANENGWKFKAKRARWHSAPDPYYKERGYTCGLMDVAAFARLRTRLLELFNDRRLDNLNASMFLAPQCLYCSKALTDPVSMARMIGPECAETTSNHLPFIINPTRLSAVLPNTAG